MDSLKFYLFFIFPLFIFLWILKKTKFAKKFFVNWNDFYWQTWIVVTVNIVIKSFLQYLLIFKTVRFTFLIPLLIIEFFILCRTLVTHKNNTPKSSLFYNFLKITTFLYSTQTQKQVFEPIASDWEEEYFEALFKKEIWKARWINVRYTYAFLAAMWQKSPIGDLIEFISKFAK